MTQNEPLFFFGLLKHLAVLTMEETQLQQWYYSVSLRCVYSSARLDGECEVTVSSPFQC